MAAGTVLAFIGNLQGTEILIIAILALLILGPERLPQVAKQFGKVVRELRRISGGFESEIRAAMDDVTETEGRARGTRHRRSASMDEERADDDESPMESMDLVGSDDEPLAYGGSSPQEPSTAVDGNGSVAGPQGATGEEGTA